MLIKHNQNTCNCTILSSNLNRRVYTRIVSLVAISSKVKYRSFWPAISKLTSPSIVFYSTVDSLLTPFQPCDNALLNLDFLWTNIKSTSCCIQIVFWLMQSIPFVSNLQRSSIFLPKYLWTTNLTAVSANCFIAFCSTSQRLNLGHPKPIE